MDLPGEPIGGDAGAEPPVVEPPVEPPVVDAGPPIVEPPVEPPMKPPVEPPMKPPVEPPMKPPVEPPMKPPVEPPMKPPVEPPMKPPVEPPVKPPVEPPVEPPVVEADAGADAAPEEPEEPPPPAAPSFEADVWPIFVSGCAPCHTVLGLGGHNVGSADLATAFADAQRLGERLIARLDGGGMPVGCAGNPGDPGCIAVDDLALIQGWIDGGFEP